MLLQAGWSVSHRVNKSLIEKSIFLKKMTKEQNLGQPQLLKSEREISERSYRERESPNFVHTLFPSIWMILESYIHMVDSKHLSKKIKKYTEA